MLSPWMLPLLAACGGVSVALDDSAPVATLPGDSGTAPVDTATVEHLPPVETQPGLCALELVCQGPIQDEPKTSCRMVVTDDQGRVEYDGRAGLDVRGRSSASFPKHQYAAELWDADGASVETDLLGMGSESDWILNGAYVDRALFRSALVYDSFQALAPERYAPESRFCHLTLDGDWLGIYLLTERVKRDGSRLDLAPDESGDASTFIVKLDDEDGLVANSGGTGTWQLVYPREDDATAGQIAGATSALAAWVRAYGSENPADPETGIFTHLDLASSVDLVLAEELAKNVDGYYLSLYLYRQDHGLMSWVPWDLDLTFGQPSYNDNESPQGWIVGRPSFIDSMSDVPAFRAALVTRWAELRAGPLADSALLGRVDGYVAVMGDTVYENFERWPIADIEFGWSGVNYLYAVSSYDEELARVRAWIPERTAWMDAHIDTW